MYFTADDVLGANKTRTLLLFLFRNLSLIKRFRKDISFGVDE